MRRNEVITFLMLRVSSPHETISISTLCISPNSCSRTSRALFIVLKNKEELKIQWANEIERLFQALSPVLNKVLVAPLSAEITFRPLSVNVQESQVITAFDEKVFSCCVCQKNLVFRSVENCSVDWKHSRNADYFLCTFVPATIPYS